MDWFRKFLGKAVGATLRNLNLVRSNLHWQRWVFGEFSFVWAVKEGYRINSAVFACVRALAFSFPEPPLLTGTEIDGKFTPAFDDELMALLKQPNPDQGEAEFMQYCVTYAAIGGNCYIWKQRNEFGEVIALWPFNDAWMWPVPAETTADGFVSHYEYQSEVDTTPIKISKKDVVHWKWMPDPLNPCRGMGGIQASAREIGKDNEANAYVYSLLKNNAVPPIVITMTEDEELTQDKVDRNTKFWKQQYGGKNAGLPAFLEYGMTVQKLGFDLQQLATDALSGMSEARIAGNFGVPPVVAGLSVGLKRSDYGDQAARRSFTELTLVALWRFMSSEMWASFKDDRVKGQGNKKRPANFAMQFNLRVVRALQEDETKRWETATSAFDRSGITRAEMKIYLGIEPKAGDDVYKVSLANEFVPAGQAVVRDTTGGGKGSKAFTRFDAKAASQRVAAVLRKQRVKLAAKMKPDVQKFFDDLADNVVNRAEGMKARWLGSLQLKDAAQPLPTVDDLLGGDTFDELGNIFKRYYATMLELSWDTWNLELGVELAFDLADPTVRKILGKAGDSISDIEKTTKDALRSTLQFGEQNGWSIDDLIRGKDGQPGLRDLIEQTYQGRAEVISRTELGTAQNAAAAERYGKAGVDKVVILDNGSEDDDEACKVANTSPNNIWTLALFMENPLQHPNCTRAAAAYFGDDEALTEWTYKE